jgi:hypothetical protein
MAIVCLWTAACGDSSPPTDDGGGPDDGLPLDDGVGDDREGGDDDDADVDGDGLPEDAGAEDDGDAADDGEATPPPGGVPLFVRDTAGRARDGEVAASGVPLPREMAVTDASALAVTDASGVLVPAEFRVLARWNAGLDEAAAPIQWLLVAFPATVAADGTAEYRLVLDGSAGANPAPAVPVTVEETGDRITVDTGVAVFRFGGDALFDEIRLADGTAVVTGGETTGRVDGRDVRHATTRRHWIEQAGPLRAVVVVEGAYDMPPVGDGGLGSLRRYVFAAGSGTAIVRHAVAWEGSRCAAHELACGDGTPNAVLVERLRDVVGFAGPGPRTAIVVGAADEEPLSASLGDGDEVELRQLLRASRTAPPSFEMSAGSERRTGLAATGGMLAVAGGGASLAVALRQMERYEPQALRVLADGRVAIDLADDKAWLANHQGLFATIAVRAAAAGPTAEDLMREVWAPLHRPLRPWPEASWFHASRAVDEVPAGALPADLEDYEALLAQVVEATLRLIPEKGIQGLMTFGVYPRYWGTAMYGDELDCADDPTPGEDWDQAFWCATWTDYHNTVAAVPIAAMRSGELKYVDDLALPGALRTLHTQIMQCAPGDGWFRCGQAPSGYRAYRSDDNGSHAYFDNLFLHYWLTGDSTVVRALERGAEAMRGYFCSRRPAEACLPTDPPTDEWAAPVGRVASQWAAVFRFVGLAGDDPGFLEDWASMLARAVTQFYAEPVSGGTSYGFWSDLAVAPGTNTTGSLWMVSLYDMNNLYRLLRDTADAPLGEPALPPSRILLAWARTLVDYGATVSGDGTAAGTWPNQLDWTWSGDRIGGALEAVVPNTGGSDPQLWPTGKANLTALLVRAGLEAGDAELLDMGRALTALSIAAALADGGPLGKIQGLFLARLHAAVARLTAGE